MSSSTPPGAVGKTCPYCRTTIEPGVPAVVCPQCGIPHHADCWQENGRCTTFGCQGGTPAGGGVPRPDLAAARDRPCPVCGFMMRPTEYICPYCRTSIYANRPPAQAPGGYPMMGTRPHRAGTVLAYGVLSMICCVFFGIAAWSMGNEDLAAMNAGLMDASGRSATEVGRILGIISMAVNGAVLFLWVLRVLSGQ